MTPGETGPFSLRERIAEMRRRVRLRLGAYGVFLVVSGGVLSFLTVMTLDYLLWLPPLLRLLGAVFFVGGAVGAVLQWIVRPLRARLTLDEVCARLEGHFGFLRDRLQSAVCFLDHPDAGSAEMKQAMIATTEKMLAGVRLEDALALRPLVGWACTCVAAILTVLLLTATAPGWVVTGVERYLRPWSGVEWPRTVAIEPLTGDQMVAVGESVTVTMRVTRGLTDTLRAVVRLRNARGDITTLALQREPDGRFYAGIDAVTENLTYWFEADDDNTSRTPASIRVVRRPEVIEALATVEPPAYARNRTEWVHDLADGPVRAPTGGFVKVAVRTSKPVQTDVGSQSPGLRTDGGERIALSAVADDRREVWARWEVTGDTSFRVELWDEDGLENRGSAAYSIVASPDQSPSVSFLEPKGITEVTPADILPLHIRVEDDFGVSEAALEMQPVQGEAPAVIPLTEYLEAVEEPGGADAAVRYDWNLEPLALSPGDLLPYRAAAKDNRTTPVGTPQVGRSPWMQLKVISESEFELRVRGELALLETRVRQITSDQADLVDRTELLLSGTPEAQPLSEAQRDEAATLASKEGQLGRRLHELADRFSSVGKRMDRSRAARTEMRARIAALGESLRTIAGGAMTNAAAALNRSTEQAGAAEQQQTLHEATRHEQTALERLRAAVQAMTQWTSFQELVGKTRDLLDRQNEVSRRTTEIGRSTLGRELDALTESESAALKRTAREQEQLGIDVEQLLQRMEQLGTSPAERGESATEAIQDALRAARALDLRNHLRSAAEAIGGNRTSAATIAQRNAAVALSKVIAALRRRDDRELEELRKQLQQAVEQVAALLHQQQELRTTSRRAVDEPENARDWDSLSQEQRTLRRNARALGDELGEAEHTAPAAQPVRQSAAPMGRAETRLSEQDPAGAGASQEEAAALLEEALARLDEAAAGAMEETVRRSLAQIREDLEAILAAQRAVHHGVTELVAGVRAHGRMGRPEAHAASKLSKDQDEVRALVEAQSRDFEEVVVYHWALERVGRWMVQARDQLNDRRLDNELPATTGRITRELEKLVRAIVETAALPVDTQFVESQSGEGGQGMTRSGKLVPTVAELLVLKAMQVDLSERTTALHESLDPERASESQLGELKVLGEDQAEVRRLTEMVTERVRRP